ncbi:MAG TPA: S1 RNA-binding domain-containing protein [Anaerolineaceae bacterium]|nr:S1 RNA-binding domain-containing protein [Anaerolineaceae bacterium]HOG79828.1 S1 RNA-binding domain-containing protein [Anaerolineaceae bacterium]
MEINPAADTNRATEIKSKMHFTGTVKTITLAGAVIDIGVGTPAVLHISQMAASTEGQPIKSVREVLQEGQTIDVWVRRVKDNRVELTMFRPLDLEWRDLKKGMVVKGKVVRLEKFGAFIEIGAERPGLVHISEMAHSYVRLPSDVVNEGDEVEAEVIDVDRKKKQIKLSMKALQPEPVKEEEPEMPVEMAPRRERTERGERGERPARRRTTGKGGRREHQEDNSEAMAALAAEAAAAEAEPTAMGLAWQEAMEKAKTRREERARKGKSGATSEHEEIFSRTLEQKSQQ